MFLEWLNQLTSAEYSIEPRRSLLERHLHTLHWYRQSSEIQSSRDSLVSRSLLPEWNAWTQHLDALGTYQILRIVLAWGMYWHVLAMGDAGLKLPLGISGHHPASAKWRWTFWSFSPIFQWHHLWRLPGGWQSISLVRTWGVGTSANGIAA